MTPTEAAQAFGVSRQTVNQMIRDGEFRSLHVIGPTSRPQYVVSRDEVDRLKRTRELPRAKTRHWQNGYLRQSPVTL